MQRTDSKRALLIMVNSLCLSSKIKHTRKANFICFIVPFPIVMLKQYNKIRFPTVLLVCTFLVYFMYVYHNARFIECMYSMSRCVTVTILSAQRSVRYCRGLRAKALVKTLELPSIQDYLRRTFPKISVISCELESTCLNHDRFILHSDRSVIH